VPFPPGLRALNHPEFRRFYTAQLVAQVGGWIQNVAQAWLVLQLTGSPLRLGIINALQSAPVLFFSLMAGVIVDRLPKRTVLITTQSIFAAQAFGLAVLVWTGAAEYWHVCVLALVLGFVTVLDQPTRHSLVSEMVGRDDVGNAVALNSAAFNAARIVGPAVAGVLIARAGVAPAFAVNGLGFAIVIATLVTLRAPARAAPRSGGTMVQEMVEGLVYARRTPLILLVLGIQLVLSLCVFNFSVYVPLLARQVLGLGAEGFGFLMAFLGVGAVAGALTVGMARQPSLRVLFGAGTGALLGLLGLSAAREFWVAAPLLSVTGFAGIATVSACNARLQLAAPAELRGRLISIYILLSSGVFPIGAFLVGAISQRWSVSTAFFLGGATGLMALGAIGLWWRSRAGAGTTG
jgi:predicted MFS family arabinose efflux permease